jgi:hypothetical protein
VGEQNREAIVVSIRRCDSGIDRHDALVGDNQEPGVVQAVKIGPKQHAVFHIVTTHLPVSTFQAGGFQSGGYATATDDTALFACREHLSAKFGLLWAGLNLSESPRPIRKGSRVICVVGIGGMTSQYS